jgi:hypothetical protein
LIKKLVPEKGEVDSEGEEVEQEEEEDVRLSMDLPEETLKVNLGVPIVVVV